MLQATRTLVKSAPELWAEVNDPAALQAHLEVFGPVTIDAAEPEKVVHWSAEHASGTLELETAGFGTRVRLRAESSVISEPVVAAPAHPAEPVEGPKRGVWSRLWRRKPPRIEVPDPVEIKAAAIPALSDDQVLTVLRETLDALGSAHHRPFSRA